ncbi:50S ribosomal protein L11 methyltransferase [Candidatus Thioglobus autotrophicus]|uniref:50S ribosomal protein L11 methyltransferase n=1 Tax=Candidatus Thioglobus autotrophicus TaxID=1705394 RepID=UPI00299E31B3|nr:50S ribosomal protein L11 methyltransferase [Candidatus Thioglobus autotrophicus]WPE16229.1 50S ribosomal protein L11 methyltransferase [Candidatus Thioglobus autotrophicus]WPE17668.1 50S ribosomal protein L11 methyltransferase [Candidatus Thioglobus autotrophicus]
MGMKFATHGYNLSAMDWMQLTLQTNKDQADFVSEILTGLESVSVTFCDTNNDAIFEPPVGETPLWQYVTITALFALDVDQAHVKQMLDQICHIKTANFELLKDRVWEDECKRDFHVMQFGKRLWICPSWENSGNLPDDAVIIDMDPGLAFGTGTHQTTDLCLQYLEANAPINCSVIDYGSGTGILAIAAVKLGAKAAVAVDNDPQAIIATMSNVEVNQAQDQICVLHTEDEGRLDPVDLLIANILANPLVGLCEHFSQLVKPGGSIALSGIMQDQLPMILEAYGVYFEALEVAQKDEWCRVSGQRK